MKICSHCHPVPNPACIAGFEQTRDPVAAASSITESSRRLPRLSWIPAFAGMTLLCELVTLALLLGLTALPTYPAFALTEEEAALEAAMPVGNTLERLKAEIAATPDNLDYYFSYAATAKQMKQYEEAVWALTAMLQRDPNLTRVKLELGLIYIEMERFTEARQMFEEAMQTDLPDEVKKNVESILAALDEREKIHHFSAVTMTGMNNDSNANSAPSSGNVTVVDTSIPLGAGAGSESDTHAYAALGLNHTYNLRLSKDRPSWRWKSSALSYGTEQDTLDNLNLQLYTLKTGPEITLAETPLRISAMAGYNHIILDHQSYLRNPKFDISLDWMAMQNLMFGYGLGYEYRGFLNSDTVTTYHDRSGRAYQHAFTMRNILSEKAMLETVLTLRNENAKQQYYSNDQASLNVTLTHALFTSAFISASGGYKVSSYLVPDTLISANDREDDEFSYGVTFGYNVASDWAGNFLISTGYQYRDVKSTIENYTYDNHRFMLSLAKEFKY